MKDKKWICIRNNIVIAIFDNRNEAVSYLKQLLKQSLADFNKQDKDNSFDYAFTIPETKFIEVEYRPTYLGLI